MTSVPTQVISDPEERLAELGIELPDPPPALGAYTPIHIVGDLLYTSGVLPMWNGELRYVGTVGDGMRVSDGAAAARLCALNVLALLRTHLGTLDAVRQIVQISGFVRSARGFGQQPQVMNGASEVLYELFGERGRHTRTALGTSELPLGATVELNAVVRIFPDMVRGPVAAAETVEQPAPRPVGRVTGRAASRR